MTTAVAMVSRRPYTILFPRYKRFYASVFKKVPL